MPRRPAIEEVPLERKLSLTPPEIFALTGLSDSAVRRLIDAGVLARVQDTERVLVARVELDRWLAGRPREVLS